MSNLTQALAKPYLRAGLAHVRSRLRNRRSPRSFTRTCIVAELARNNGIAQGARLQHAFLRSCGVDAHLVDATAAARNPLYRAEHVPGTAYIFHSGGPQMPNLIRSVFPAAKDAYRIAYWAWEIPVYPRNWPAPESLVDEIWTCSEHAKRAISSGSNVPVKIVPHVLTPVAKPKHLGTPFEVLAFADSRSSLQRKNPIGAIQAFWQAFGQSQRARLTLKLNGRPDELAPIIKAASTANVRILTEFLSPGALADLLTSSHVLLSLHRAEGFGLPMFEAMSHALPVIATGWSGNLDFMSAENSLLVRSATVPIGNDPVYHAYPDVCWADPDIAVASDHLRRLSSDQALYHRYSSLALQAVSSFAARASQQFIAETLNV